MSVFRPLYNWAMKQAQKPYAFGLLFLVAITEPCISPIPPDVLLIPMSIAHRDRAFKFAAASVLGLFLGSIAGYLIGVFGMDTIGKWLIHTYHLQDGVEKFQDIFDKWGLAAVVAKGLVPLVPIPLILLVVGSGAAGIHPLTFSIAIILSQGARLFLEAYLIRRYGAPVQQFIERYLTWIGVAILVLVGAVVYLVAK
jgi:hypothetical protein